MRPPSTSAAHSQQAWREEEADDNSFAHRDQEAGSEILADSTPSQAPEKTELFQERAATLAYIEARIAELYSTDKLDQQLDKSALLDRKTYLELYHAIEHYTTAPKPKRGERLAGSHRGAHLLGEDAYKSLVAGIRTCCRDVLAQIMENSDAEGVLAAYVKYWTSYLTLSELSANVFRYLERHWVKRELDETKTEVEKKRKGLYLISDLHMVVWREEVLGEGGQILVAVLALQQKEGEQKVVDTTLASFAKVGVAIDGKSLVVL